MEYVQIKIKPSFLKHPSFYLCRKPIYLKEKKKFIGKNHSIVGAIGGGLGSLMMIYGANYNSVVIYLLLTISWLFCTALISYLIIKPEIVSMHE